MNPNVVIPPSNVEFGEQGGIFHVINEVLGQGQGVSIPDSEQVQVTVVLARMERSILLGNEEEQGCLGDFNGMM